jgi:hypothetical protein
MPFKNHSTGDAIIDKLITDYSNAVFDCGDFRDEGEDPCYDEDRKYKTYDEAQAMAETAREALYSTLTARLGMGKEVKP